MSRKIQIRKSILHYGLLAVCVATFLFSCLGFILLEVLIKPIVFAAIFLCAAPLGVIELFRKHKAT